MNWGGSTSNANGGFSLLFNFDPTVNFSFAVRTGPNDHMGFTLTEPTAWKSGFQPAPQSYDRPIAVLIGPGCFSAGDNNASRIRFHPTARLFGKPTNGARVAPGSVSGSLPDSWKYSFYTQVAYSKRPDEGYLIHKGVQPDEVVWLTREDAAKGDDTVVKRAIAWIRKTTSVQLGQQEPRSHALLQN